jgi:hypothetical protein
MWDLIYHNCCCLDSEVVTGERGHCLFACRSSEAIKLEMAGARHSYSSERALFLVQEVDGLLPSPMSCIRPRVYLRLMSHCTGHAGLLGQTAAR